MYKRQVNNAAKTTSGAVSFMDFYSYITGLIGQSGRRGALMISISVSYTHLDVYKRPDSRMANSYV